MKKKKQRERENPPDLDWVVGRARSDVFFVEHALQRYKALHGMSNRELAMLLGCDIKALSRLGLCRRPDDHASQFNKHVCRIASYAPCNPDRLVQVLREVSALASLQDEESNHPSSSFLIAARDRKSEANSGEKNTSSEGIPQDRENRK